MLEVGGLCAHGGLPVSNILWLRHASRLERARIVPTGGRELPSDEDDFAIGMDVPEVG